VVAGGGGYGAPGGSAGGSVGSPGLHCGTVGHRATGAAARSAGAGAVEATIGDVGACTGSVGGGGDGGLGVGGTLDRTMGGPSVKPFVATKGVHVTPNVYYGAFNLDGPGAHRRGVYRFVFRTLPDPFLEALDHFVAHGSEARDGMAGLNPLGRLLASGEGGGAVRAGAPEADRFRLF